MYSETITKNDLAGILNGVIGLANVGNNGYGRIAKTNFTANNTLAKVTGASISAAGDCFETGTDQITSKRSGQYLVSMSFVCSAVTTATNVKRITLYRNGNSLQSALGRPSTYEDISIIRILSLNAGDVMTMWARAEDGNSTYEWAEIDLIPCFS